MSIGLGPALVSARTPSSTAPVDGTSVREASIRREPAVRRLRARLVPGVLEPRIHPLPGVRRTLVRCRVRAGARALLVRPGRFAVQRGCGLGAFQAFR
ncbi:hypothetical protein [Actinoplanes sp. NPDC049599]|uniref:hypothetical protein n=1 Tax=Actinoplanes sp. NPDC049599 TaxID=3363903 RepID=UPI00378E3949